MDKAKSIKLAVSFPVLPLTDRQKTELKNALKSAVVTTVPKLMVGQVNVEYKQNECVEK